MRLSTFQLGVAVTAAALVGLPKIAWAQQEELRPSAVVEGFLAEIRAGDLKQAEARISRIESLSGKSDDILPLSRAELVSLLATCNVVEHKVSGSIRFRMEKLSLTCPGDKLEVSLISEADPTNPYVNVVGIRNAEKTAAAMANPPVLLIPPPAPLAGPRALTESQKAEIKRLELAQVSIRDAFGKAVLTGDLDQLAHYVTPQTRIVYQTRDPFFDTDLVEISGHGMDVAQQVFARAKSDLGKLRSVECEKDDAPNAPHICRWKMKEMGKGMFAFLHFRQDTLSAVQVFYVTQEKYQQMRERAIKAGKIDG